jgi:hypothetical protein
MVPTAPDDTDMLYHRLDSKLARSEFYATQRAMHTRAWRQYQWEHSRGVWSSAPGQLRNSSCNFVGSRTEVWRLDSVKASLGICKLWRKGCQCFACREMFVARPLQVTRKEIERSIREDLKGIRRPAAGCGSREELSRVSEGEDREPELSGEDAEDSSEEGRGVEGLEYLQRNLQSEVPLMELLHTHRRHHRK